MADALRQSPMDIIGPSAPADWELAVEAHAHQLPREAGALRRLLTNPDIIEILHRYRDADAKASAAQTEYRKVGQLVIVTRFIALIAGGVAMMPIEPLFYVSVRPVLIVIQVIALSTSVLAALWLSRRRVFIKWA